MSEPISSIAGAGAVAATVGITALLPGVDPGALIGAFAGSVTFALSAKDTAIWERLVSLMVSLIVGYVFVPGIASLSFFKEPTIIAFFASSLSMPVTFTLIDRIKKIEVIAAWSAFWKRGG